MASCILSRYFPEDIIDTYILPYLSNNQIPYLLKQFIKYKKGIEFFTLNKSSLQFFKNDFNKNIISTRINYIMQGTYIPKDEYVTSDKPCNISRNLDIITHFIIDVENDEEATIEFEILERVIKKGKVKGTCKLPFLLNTTCMGNYWNLCLKTNKPLTLRTRGILLKNDNRNIVHGRMNIDMPELRLYIIGGVCYPYPEDNDKLPLFIPKTEYYEHEYCEKGHLKYRVFMNSCFHVTDCYECVQKTKICPECGVKNRISKIYD